MRSPFHDDILSELHASIDRVAQALLPEHPQLAAAMRAHATRLPAPPAPSSPTARAPRAVPPLAYRALDEGLLDGEELDRLLVRHQRAQALLRARKRGGYSDGSPSASLSSMGSTRDGGPSRRGASACR